MGDRYLLFHKPYDVLTQFSDPQLPMPAGHTDPGPAATGRDRQTRTLKDFIPVPDVYPVGRLDRDSEGLLLLTSNGRLQHWLTDPKFQHPRTYWVQVEHIPTDRDLEPLRRGIPIQTYRTRPAIARLLTDEPSLPPRTPPIRVRQSIPTAWLELTLTEGRNRQVRRMTAAIGFPTLRLVRVAIAHLRLEGLEPGQWRDLTDIELESLLRPNATPSQARPHPLNSQSARRSKNRYQRVNRLD